MRNLKKLLAVIVAICVLATFTVPAFAADISEEAQICEDLGLLEGDTSAGVDEVYLAKETQRLQAAIIYLRLFGLEDEALAYDGEENFSDAEEMKWPEGRNILAYLHDHPELGWVGDAGKFDPYGLATPKMIYKVLLTALGYVEDVDFTWDETLEFAEEKGLSLIADVETVTNDDLAVALVEALKVNIKDGSKTFVEKLIADGLIDEAKAIEYGLVPEELTASVAATGAKKLTVTFNKAVDDTKVKIEVKRGSVKPSVKSITFAEDKKSAVIEFSTKMSAGDYTVTITGLTDTAITATVKVEAEKLTSISFVNDYLVMKNDTGDQVVTTVKAVNQYGEDITSTITGANISTSKGRTASLSSKGVLTITGAAGEFKVDDKVVVTIVDVPTGVLATATLTVVKAPAVASIEFGELTTDEADLKGKEINVTAMTDNATKYYLPITVKDQYGNTFDAANCNVAISVMSSNSNIVKLANPAIVDTDNGTVVKFVDPNVTPEQYGTVVITAVAAASGKSASTNIVVKENAKIDVVTLSAPETDLKLTKEAVLPVSVVDTYGNEVALKDITFGGDGTSELTLNTNTKITATNATFKVTRDYVKDVATIKITPTAKTVVLTVTTATGKFQSLTLTALDAPVVTAIKGVKSDFVSRLANDSTLSTNLAGNVEFLDQYGEAIGAPGYAYTGSSVDTLGIHYTIAKKETSNITTFDATSATGTITASSAGVDYYVVSLKNGSNVIDSIEVPITIIDADKITEFTIADLNKFYTETDAALTHTQTIKIYGLVDGQKVEVNQNMIKNITATGGLNGKINETTHVYTPADADTDGADKTSTITVVVANSKNTYFVTKEVVYSDAAPKASEIVVKYDGKVVEGGVVQVPASELNGKSILPTGTTKSKLQFEAKDQYGVQRQAGYTIVVTNNETGGTINAAGVGSGFGVTTGKAMTLNVFIDGIYQSLKVIVE